MSQKSSTSLSIKKKNSPSAAEYQFEEENVEDKKFICQTTDSYIIKTLIESIKDLIEDTNLKISKDGIQILTVDNNKCCIIHLHLVPSNFYFYYCETEFQIGLSLKNLFILLKTMSNGDVISLFVLKKTPNRLNIILENKQKKLRDISDLKLLDIDQSHYEIPPIQFDSVIKMPSADFQKICKDLMNIDSVVCIQSKNNIFSMSVNGSIGKKEIIIQQNQHTHVQNNEDKEDFCDTYQLKYLISFVKSTNLCSNVEIYLKKDKPIVLIYSAGTLGSLKFLLFPFDNSK